MNAILRIATTIAFATAVPTAALAQAAPAAEAHQHGGQAAPAGQNAPEQSDRQQTPRDEPACQCPCKMMMQHMGEHGDQAQPSPEVAPQHQGH